MSLIKRWLGFLVLLCVLLFGIFFSVQNDTPVPLDLLMLQLPEQAVALWILLAFALGGILGLAITSVTVMRLRSRNALLQRRLDKRQQELNQLKTADFKPGLIKAGKSNNVVSK